MEKIIKYCGFDVKVGCDEKCNKAWGINDRPFIKLSKDGDDYAWLSDDELGEAPVSSRTIEGDTSKPFTKNFMLNKWCVRQCERCAMSNINQSHLPLTYKDFSKRIYNQPWKHDQTRNP